MAYKNYNITQIGRTRFALLIFYFAVAFLASAQTNQLFFSENKNQWPEQVLFKADLHEGLLFLEKDGLTYNFYDPVEHTHHGFSDNSGMLAKRNINHSEKSHSYKVVFEGMNIDFEIEKTGKQAGVENYYIGNDPQFWASGVESFDKIIYKNIYDNIDICFYDNFGLLKYDFIIHPGGDPSQIKLRYENVDNISIEDKKLKIETSVNIVTENIPYSFQNIYDSKKIIHSKYKLKGNVVTIYVDKYDTAKTLIIDPELVFSTYSGSPVDNWGFTATFDNNGAVYSGGIVRGTGYPTTPGAYEASYSGGRSDILIIKYNETGTDRLYATHLGGNSSEMPHSLIVNSNNELLIFGTTGSGNFPTINAYDNTFNGGTQVTYDDVITFENGVDIFVAKLNEDGSNLLASTYIGGSQNDGLNFRQSIPDSKLQTGNDSLYYNYGDGARGEIMVDNDDNVYVGTCTFSTDFPTKSAFQPTSNGRQEGVVFKFNSNMNNLIWSSYYGGNEDDIINSIDVDDAGFTYITGGAVSQNIFTTASAPFQFKQGGTVDAFVAKIAQNGSSLIGSTYFGSNQYDQAHFVRIDNDGFAYLFGQTKAIDSTLILNHPAGSNLYATPNSGQFLAKFDNNLMKLEWSTVFGTGNGKPNITPTAFAVDICNMIYLAGSGREWWELTTIIYDPLHGRYRYDLNEAWDRIEGTKGMEVTPDADTSVTDGQDYYIMVIDKDINNLEYATFLGELHDTSSRLFYNSGMSPDEYRCPYGGRDHVDGGTSRFDENGNIYQSVCASCGGCNAFRIKPKPGVWAENNGSINCNNAVFRFDIELDRVIADFILPQINCDSKDVTFINTSKVVTASSATYTWDFGDGSPLSNEKEPKHFYSIPGNYTVTLLVEDPTACNFLDSISDIITVDSISSVDTLGTIHMCKGGSSEIGLPSTYDPNVSYKWIPSTDLSNDTISNPVTSTDTSIQYKLYITEGSCSRLLTQDVIVHNDSLAVSYTISVDGEEKEIVCTGDRVRITITADGEVESYFWFDNDQMTTPINSDYSQDYITVTAINNIVYYVKVMPKYCATPVILEIPLIVSTNIIHAGPDTLICGGSTVELWAINYSPENPVIWNWTPTNSLLTPGTTDRVTAKPTQPTIYTVTARNEHNCTFSKTVNVDVDVIDLNPSSFQDITCRNDNDGFIILEPGLNTPYQYLWENGDSQNVRFDLSEGIYSVTVTDNLGCVASRTFQITNPDLLRLDTTVYSTTCDVACNGKIVVNPRGGTAPYNYNWSNTKTTQNQINLCIGDYAVTVTDSHGCTISEDFTVSMDEFLPLLSAYSIPGKIYKGQSAILHPYHAPSDSVQYRWFPDWALDDYKKVSPTASPDTTLTYYVFATDQWGCSNIDTLTLKVVNFICGDPFVFVPNAFSPNNDGTNDILYIKSNILTEIYFAIFDRWGEKVFETTDVSIGWDGTYKGKKLSPAVFVYYIEASCLNNEKYIREGNVTLIR